MITDVNQPWKRLLVFALVMSVAGLGALAFTLAQPSPSEAASTTALEELSSAFKTISKDSSAAVVNVDVERTVRRRGAPSRDELRERVPEDLLDFFFGPRGSHPNIPDEFQQRGQGSGFIISSDGYILTNNHVVGDASRVSVRLSDGREFEAEVVGSDKMSDVAVIKVDATGLPSLPLGDSDSLEQGEWVIAVGSPFGLSHTVTAGIVSAIGRGSMGLTEYGDFIQTDAAINPGNSGGPLLNLDGEVVGLNTAIFSRSGGYMGIGLAIPINMVKAVRDQLIETGAVTRGYLGVGIQAVTPEFADEFGLADANGIIVAHVQEGKAADQAGITRGDVIVKLNGDPVGEVEAFRNTISLMRPGTKVRLELLRDGRAVRETVELGELESESTRVARVEGPQKDLGITVQDMDQELAQRLGLESESGIVITNVEPNSNAARKGLRPGMVIREVNRKPVTDVRRFREAIEANEDDTVLLLVEDDKFTSYIVLRLESE
jgi:serine protease Do